MKWKSVLISTAVICLSVSALAACGKQYKDTVEQTAHAEENEREGDTPPDKIALTETSESQHTTESTEESTYEWEATVEAPDWDGVHREAVDDDKNLTGEELLESVLLGRHSFIVAENDEINIPGIKAGDTLKLEEFYALTNRARILDMIIVDVDGDGVKDAVTQSFYNLGRTMVFHTEGDKVYMWGSVARGAVRFMTDGTFSGSGGASDTHYYRLTFDKNAALRNELAHMTLKYSDVDNTSEWEYVVEGKNVSGDEFEAYCGKWEDDTNLCEKAEFTDDNIRKAFEK